MKDIKREVIEFSTEQEWLEERSRDLTSTEVAALFGISPYMTAYELWHRKTGQLPISFEANERMKWGNRLESAIAYGIAEDLGLVVEPFKTYIRLPDLRVGSSFDFKVVGIESDWREEENEYRDLFRQRGPGVLEVKNTDFIAFRRGWIKDGDLVEAPPHIEIQVQHQMLVAGLPWACVAPLVAGNTPLPFWREYDQKVGRAILAKAGEFWQSIADGKAPNPEYDKDADTIAALLLNDDGETLDLSDNERFDEACAAYKAAAADAKDAETRKQAAKGEILDIMGTAAGARGAHFKVSAKTRKGSPGKTVTPGMVGEVIGARKPTRYPTVSEVKS